MIFFECYEDNVFRRSGKGAETAPTIATCPDVFF